MSYYAFGAALEPTKSSLELTTPPAVKTKSSNPVVPIELEEYLERDPQSHAQHPRNIEPVAVQTSQTPRTDTQTFGVLDDLEMSRPSSPREHDAVAVVPSWSYPSMNKYRVLAACCTYFVNGLNDASAGAIIPYMETQYDIGYAVVSLIFVTNAIGFIASAFMTDLLVEKLGRAKASMVSETWCIIGYVILACTPPFPLVVVAFLFLGLGIALNLALNNVFCANLANSTVILGAAHGSYGIGGTVAPIIATAMASRGIVWSRFYLITLSIRCFCFFFTAWAFWTYESETTSITPQPHRRVPNTQDQSQPTPSKLQMLKHALNNRTTIMGALFVFAYQGAEVSVSGWVISFLINARRADPAKVGYVTSGFWGGITLGRFILSHLAPRIGEKRFVYILTALSVVFQLLVWLIPNIVGEAVAVSILGLLQGPVYPCATTIFTRLLGRDVQVTALSFISSAGSSGGAVAPFTTGLLAQAVGTFVLHPICIGLFVVMVACWFGLPRVVKRTE